MELRPYQAKAIRATYNYWENYDTHGIIVLPTGTGKSFVIAKICEDMAPHGARIICATHVKELVKQNYLELIDLLPFAPAGVYSAGLNSRDSNSQIVFGGIQTIYNKAYELQKCDILIVDECQTISPEDETRWNKFIADLLIINPGMRILGLSATPYRTSSGMLTEEYKGKKPIFDDIIYEYGILEAVRDGYLCEIIPKDMDTEFDISNVNMRGGEFVAGELEAAVNIDAITAQAIDEVMIYGQNRKTWLVFCSGSNHAYAVRDELKRRGIKCEAITDKTSSTDRDKFIEQLKTGELQALTNNNILTTGTNIPRIDMIVGLRWTGSPGLYVQILGRGMRLFPGKDNCLYLDFAKNAYRFGPLDKIKPRKPGQGNGDAPMKKCKFKLDNLRECGTIVYASTKICPDCLNPFPFEEPELKISANGDSAALLSDQVKPEWHNVIFMSTSRHEKPGKIPSLCVTYGTPTAHFKEWICFEHEGYAWEKAEKWHDARMDTNAPHTIEEAVKIKYPKPTRIQVIPDGKFFRIKAYDFETLAEDLETEMDIDEVEFEEDDIPF